MRQRQNTALPAGTLSITLKAKQLKLVVPILIELKNDFEKKLFNWELWKIQAKIWLFKKKKNCFWEVNISFFAALYIASTQIIFYSDGPVILLPFRQYPNPFLKHFLVQTAQFQSAKILDHCAQARKRIATKNQWRQLCLVASSTKPNILNAIKCSYFMFISVYANMFAKLFANMFAYLLCIRYQFEIPIAPNL